MTWWAGLALVLPVITYPGIMHTTEVPRFMLLSAFLLLFLLYFYVLRRPRLEIRLPRGLTGTLAVLASGFLVILAVASGTAFNPQEGLIHTFQFFLTFLATVLFAASVMQEEERLPRLFKALAVALIIQSLAGILQFYRLAFISPGESSRTVARALPYGLMGNRNLLGSALALLFPPCAYLVYAGSKNWKLIGGAALWLGTYGLLLTQTRSAWLALGAALLASSALVLLLRNRLGSALVTGWYKALGLFAAGVVLAVLLSLAIPNNQGLGGSLKSRAASLATPTQATGLDGSISVRLLWWRQCLQMMRAHPVVGIGPGNWSVVIPQYGCGKPGEAPAIASGNALRDHAHNVYLQTGAETGVAGFLLYASLWVVAGFLALRGILAADRNDRRMLGLAGLATMGVYAVDSLFSFPDDIIAHSLFLALALGLVIGVYESRRVASGDPARLLPLSQAALLPLVALLAFGVYLGYARGRFEQCDLLARAYVKTQQPEMVLAEVKAGLTPLITLSHYTEPLEVYTAYAYAQMGRLDQAAAAFDRAHALNPWNIFVGLDRANHLARMSRWDEAIRGYQEVLQWAPEFDSAWKGLGKAYYGKGQFKECRDALVKSDYLKDESFARLLGSAHLKLGDYPKSAAVLRAGLQQFPDSTNILENLAYVEYAQLKDLTNAGAHFKRLLALQPDHPQRDEYLSVIKYCERRTDPALPRTSNAPPAVRGTNAPEK